MNLITIIGIILIGWSFASELFFHYGQKFMKDNFRSNKDRKIFWRAEKAEIFNSMFLLVGGIILVIIGLMNPA